MFRKSFILVLPCLLIFLSFADKALGMPVSEGEVDLFFYGQKVNEIRLIQEIKNKMPHFQPERFELKQVILFAKSEHGRGSAHLLVNGDMSFDKNIPGDVRYFTPRFDNDMKTYYRIVFFNESHSSGTPWQVLLKGNVKVYQVKVILKRGGEAPVPQSAIRGNCRLKQSGNFFKPDAKVTCDIYGTGAVSYEIIRNDDRRRPSVVWAERLNPRLNEQRIETNEVDDISGPKIVFEVFVLDMRGRRILIDTMNGTLQF